MFLNTATALLFWGRITFLEQSNFLQPFHNAGIAENKAYGTAFHYFLCFIS